MEYHHYGDEFSSPPFEPERWEPRSASDWMRRDPFIECQVPVSPEFYERDQFTTFGAWSRLPPSLRRQAWREREIAARVHSIAREWHHVPGIRAIGVGIRGEGAQRRLVGIILSESALPADTSLLHRQYDIPESLRVSSDIPEEEAVVPLRIEPAAAPSRFQLGLVPPDRFVLTSSSPPLPARTPTLQAGDVVAGENPAGFRKPGTLCCIVSHQSDFQPLLLSAAHVLDNRGAKVVAYVPNPIEIGIVVDVDSGLDAAIAELNEPWIVDYRIKALNVVPAAPVMAYSDMPVQFIGGASGHQVGWLDVTNSIPVGGPSVGVMPDFRATIQAQQGDSGALLLTCHGRDSPFPSSHAGAMYSQYVESMTCAMLGLLIAGPSASLSPATRPQTYFRPILNILNRFGLQAWVRTI